MDVGANDPFEQNLTWFLEQQGWTGILIEPNPALYQRLLEKRPRCRAYQVACGSPEQVGVANLHLAVGHAQSSIRPDFDTALTGEVIRVQLRTLDSILREAGIEKIDFLSIDVEGLELDVLRGLDLGKFSPQLILVEDHMYSYEKHRYLRSKGYRLIRRTGYNNWYVPHEATATLFSVNTPTEILSLVRKVWLSYPFIKLKRLLKKVRLRAKRHLQ